MEEELFDEAVFPLRQLAYDPHERKVRLTLGRPSCQVKPLRRGQQVWWSAPNRDYGYAGIIAGVEEGSVWFDDWEISRLRRRDEGPARMIRFAQGEYRHGKYAV